MPTTPAFVGLPAYAIAGILWGAGAIFWAWLAYRLGDRLDLPNDGCLLSIGNIFLTLLGGGLGLLAAPYPWFFLSSFAGVVLLPGIVTLFFWRSNARRR